MASAGRRRKGDTSKDVGEQLLLNFCLLERFLPTDEGEFEQTIGRPGADHAEQITNVAVGLDVGPEPLAWHLAQSSTGKRRSESGVRQGAVVAADKPYPSGTRVAVSKLSTK